MIFCTLSIDTNKNTRYNDIIARELGYALVAYVFPQGLILGGQLRYYGLSE